MGSIAYSASDASPIIASRRLTRYGVVPMMGKSSPPIFGSRRCVTHHPFTRNPANQAHPRAIPPPGMGGACSSATPARIWSACGNWPPPWSGWGWPCGWTAPASRAGRTTGRRSSPPSGAAAPWCSAAPPPPSPRATSARRSPSPGSTSARSCRCSWSRRRSPTTWPTGWRRRSGSRCWTGRRRPGCLRRCGRSGGLELPSARCPCPRRPGRGARWRCRPR